MEIGQAKEAKNACLRSGNRIQASGDGGCACLQDKNGI